MHTNGYSGYLGDFGTIKPAPRGGFFCALLFSFLLAGGTSAAPVPGVSEIVVASYNIENYTLTGSQRTRIKTVVAREAVADVIAEVRPDILGLCEVGSIEALEDLRERLKKRGFIFPYAEYVDGPDPERHVALLSRFPWVHRQSLARVPYQLNGAPELVRRGFLDVTVQVNPRYALRLVGVHLKSKLPVPEGETLVRRMEARALRGLVDGILLEDPQVNLLLYGDMNDTKEDASVRNILGLRGQPFSLTDLPAEDPGGDRWTHYRFFTDVYSRIDYLMVNRALRPELVPGSARVSHSTQWRKASDHRLIYAALVPQDR
ncbi:MAG: endonuclease/exonuclease/phosphatase family [Verrucomicrobia bacterium]|nr:MAG: endonuclease/exonuclease/phosphatase family [Verrucomicrobiota bacterium]